MSTCVSCIQIIQIANHLVFLSLSLCAIHHCSCSHSTHPLRFPFSDGFHPRRHEQNTTKFRFSSYPDLTDNIQPWWRTNKSLPSETLSVWAKSPKLSTKLMKRKLIILLTFAYFAQWLTRQNKHLVWWIGTKMSMKTRVQLNFFRKQETVLEFCQVNLLNGNRDLQKTARCIPMILMTHIYWHRAHSWFQAGVSLKQIVWAIF